DYYEAEVSLDDIETAFFQELALPNLVEKERNQMITERIEFNDVRKKGLMGNIDKKRTILTALLRNAQKGRPTISPIHDEDLRFKTWNEIERHESSAVVLRSEEHTSELQSRFDLVCRLLLEKNN